MLHPDFFFSIDQFGDRSLRDLDAHLRAMPKRAVGSVRMEELCAVEDYPNGLYFLFDDDDVLWYVGKCTSCSFLERLAKHFDQRESAWFNTIPKAIRRIGSLATYAEAHARGLRLRLVMLGISSKEHSSRLERALRATLQPHLNAAKHHVDDATFVSSYLS